MSDTFTLDEVLDLVGKTVTVRKDKEEVHILPDKRRVPFLEGQHPVKGFRLDNYGYEIDVPQKPFEGQSDYYSKSEFNNVFYIF